VRSGDEPTKRQGLLPEIGSHVVKVNPETARVLWGVHPMPGLINPAPPWPVRMAMNET
jgi:hypothetical protein